MRTACVVLPLLLALPARAQAPGPEVLGFSPDGRYVAIVEHGVGEGSGFPWAKLTVLDVAKSAPALPPTQVSLESGDEKDTEAVAVARAKQALGPAAKKLKVARWQPATRVPHSDKGEVTEPSGAPVATVEVKARAASKKEQKQHACEAPFRALLLGGEVAFMDDDTPGHLGREKTMPKDRPCLGACALGELYASGKAALAFARCQAQGFEGPATVDVPLTGVLAWPLVPEPIEDPGEAP